MPRTTVGEERTDGRRGWVGQTNLGDESRGGRSAWAWSASRPAAVHRTNGTQAVLRRKNRRNRCHRNNPEVCPDIRANGYRREEHCRKRRPADLLRQNTLTGACRSVSSRKSKADQPSDPANLPSTTRASRFWIVKSGFCAIRQSPAQSAVDRGFPGALPQEIPRPRGCWLYSPAFGAPMPADIGRPPLGHRPAADADHPPNLTVSPAPPPALSCVCTTRVLQSSS